MKRFFALLLLCALALSVTASADGPELHGWAETASGSEHFSSPTADGIGTLCHFWYKVRTAGLFAILGIKSDWLRIRVCFTAKAVI